MFRDLSNAPTIGILSVRSSPSLRLVLLDQPIGHRQISNCIETLSLALRLTAKLATTHEAVLCT